MAQEQTSLERSQAIEESLQTERIIELLNHAQDATSATTYGYPGADTGEDDPRNWGVVFHSSSSDQEVRVPVVRIYELLLNAGQERIHASTGTDFATTVQINQSSWKIPHNIWFTMQEATQAADNLLGPPTQWLTSPPPFLMDPRIAPIRCLNNQADAKFYPGRVLAGFMQI